MNIDNISKLIKTKRKEKDLTQDELAEKIGVTEKAISRWETGRGTPDISLLIPLSKELDISVSELLNGKEDKKSDQNINEIVNYIDTSKTKKNKLFIYIGVIMYSLLLILYLWYLKTEYDTGRGIFISYLGEIIYNSFFMIMVFVVNRMVANNFYDKLEDRERMNKISFIIILVLYLILLLNLTVFGRRYSSFNSFNLIPFKTIIECFIYPHSHNIIVNLLGNFIILMPVEYLIIKIFNIKSFKTNLIISICISFLVEIVQLISHAGVFDIDDIILNVLGMLTIYFVVLKGSNFFKNNKKIISISIISFVLNSWLFQGLSWLSLGDIPTLPVLIRFVVCFLIIDFIIYGLYKIFKK